MAIKYVTAPLPATGAGVTSPVVNVGTFGDDSQRRHVTGVKCTNTVKLIQIELDNNAQPQAQIDLAVMGQITEFVPVDFFIDVNIQIQFKVINGSAGALVAGDAVTIRYEV